MKTVKFIKIKASYVDCKEKFYRELYVRQSLSLFEVGALLVAYFNGKFEHMWAWESKSYFYVDPTWVEEPYATDEKGNKYKLNVPFEDKDYSKFTLLDCELDENNEIDFVYDTGENWTFKVHVFLDDVIEKEIDGRKNTWAFIIDGKGEGLWEDERRFFNDFIINDVLPSEEAQLWNVENPSDFYRPLDYSKLDTDSNRLAKHMVKDLKAYQEKEMEERENRYKELQEFIKKNS